jgi:hypothetical protein
MRLGIWTPLPHTIKPEPAIQEGIRQVGTRGDRSADKSFQFALDVVSKGEAYGFDITLIAARRPHQDDSGHARGLSRNDNAAARGQDGGDT